MSTASSEGSDATVEQLVDRVYDVQRTSNHRLLGTLSAPIHIPPFALQFATDDEVEPAPHNKSLDPLYALSPSLRYASILYHPTFRICLDYYLYHNLSLVTNANPVPMYWGFVDSMHTKWARSYLETPHCNALVYRYVRRPRETILRNHYGRTRRTYRTSGIVTHFLMQEHVPTHPVTTDYRIGIHTRLWFASFGAHDGTHLSPALRNTKYDYYNAFHVHSAPNTSRERRGTHHNALLYLQQLATACQVLRKGGVFSLCLRATRSLLLPRLVQHVLAVCSQWFERVDLRKSIYAPTMSHWATVECVCVGYLGMHRVRFTTLQDLLRRLAADGEPAPSARVTGLFPYEGDWAPVVHPMLQKVSRQLRASLSSQLVFVRFLAAVSSQMIHGSDDLHDNWVALYPSPLRTRIETKQAHIARALLRTQFGLDVPTSVWVPPTALHANTVPTHVFLIQIPGTPFDAVWRALQQHRLRTRSSAHELWFWHPVRRTHVVVHSYPYVSTHGYPTNVSALRFALIDEPYARLRRLLHLVLRYPTSVRERVVTDAFHAESVYTATDFFRAPPYLQAQLLKNRLFCPQIDYLADAFGQGTTAYSSLSVDPVELLLVLQRYVGKPLACAPDTATAATDVTDVASFEASVPENAQEVVDTLYAADYVHFPSFRNHLRVPPHPHTAYLISSLKRFAPESFLLGEYLPMVVTLLSFRDANPLTVFIHRHSNVGTTHPSNQVFDTAYDELTRACPTTRVHIEENHTPEMRYEKLESFERVDWREVASTHRVDKLRGAVSYLVYLVSTSVTTGQPGQPNDEASHVQWETHGATVLGKDTMFDIIAALQGVEKCTVPRNRSLGAHVSPSFFWWVFLREGTTVVFENTRDECRRWSPALCQWFAFVTKFLRLTVRYGTLSNDRSSRRRGGTTPTLTTRHRSQRRAARGNKRTRALVPPL